MGGFEGKKKQMTGGSRAPSTPRRPVFGEASVVAAAANVSSFFSNVPYTLESQFLESIPFHVGHFREENI